jgi:hypothetical protein
MEIINKNTIKIAHATFRTNRFLFFLWLILIPLIFLLINNGFAIGIPGSWLLSMIFFIIVSILPIILAIFSVVSGTFGILRAKRLSLLNDPQEEKFIWRLKIISILIISIPVVVIIYFLLN